MTLAQTIQTAIVLLLAAPAVYRVVRLYMFDVIAEPVRNAVALKLTRKPSRFRLWLYDLQDCPWCLGVWISGFAWAGAMLTELAPVGGAWRTQAAWFLMGWFAIAALQSWWHLSEGVVDALTDRLSVDDEDDEG